MNTKCLYCYKEIPTEELQTPAGKNGYHEKCCKKFFGKPFPPTFNLSQSRLLELAEHAIKSQKSVSGIQPKMPLGFKKGRFETGDFIIQDLWGEYILKPQTKLAPFLPENEDLTMHLAELCRIKTVQHSLVKINSEELAYLTKRIDRKKGHKFHMEDMCQLSGQLTTEKYNGSYEQIVDIIKKYSANPGLDVTDFYELVLFCFLTGNNNMHLKNFSLLKINAECHLSPAYDLVATQLHTNKDENELALSLNSKKQQLTLPDFETAMLSAGLNPKVIENIFNKYKKLLPKWIGEIARSFLDAHLKNEYKELIIKKAQQLTLVK